MESAVAALLRAECAEPQRAGPLLGWKVAVNVAESQRRLGIERPLAVAMRGTPTYASGSSLHASPGARLHVEAEIVMVMAEDVHELVPVAALRSAIASYAPCFEIVDYALPQHDARALFAHGFFHAGVVLGSPVPADAFRGLEPTLPRVHIGARTHAHTPGTVPNDIVEAAHGVLSRLLAAGQFLERGQRILSGSFIEPIPLAAAMTITADFGPVLGPVTVNTEG